MQLFISYDPHITVKNFVEDILKNLDIPYTNVGAFNINLDGHPNNKQYQLFIQILESYKITVEENSKEILVKKIKEAINGMILKRTKHDSIKVSCYLSQKLGFSYAYLSKVFSEITHTTIENFAILKKIEYVKHLTIEEKLTLTEISYRLNYSSVAHLSKQFKNTTGITFTSFQNIMAKRRRLKLNHSHYELPDSKYHLGQPEIRRNQTSY